jgi:transcriptional regulator with GAF, ATPase, and Fis domain
VSVLEQFRDAEQRVAKRLKELEPMVAEYRELASVAQRLGIDGAAKDNPESATASTRSARRTRRTAAKPARRSNKEASGATGARSRAQRRAPGQREQQLLELVRARPGITVAEAGKTLGVDPTGLYRVVHRLEQRGDVKKNGRALEPAGSSTAS